MSKLKHLSADAEVKSIVAAVEQDGAVILDNVISKEFIAALREETDPYMDQTVNGEDPFAGFKTTRTGGLMDLEKLHKQFIEINGLGGSIFLILSLSSIQYGLSLISLMKMVQLKLFQAVQNGPMIKK